MIGLTELVKVSGGKLLQGNEGSEVRHLAFDSRKIVEPESSVFFAIRGQSTDGHNYISDVIGQGCTKLVVEKVPDVSIPDNVNVILVENTLTALQRIAVYHRNSFKGKVIAISGSNGKTIIKEWAFELLDRFELCVKSPLSYNSQLGVPLSLWAIRSNHQTAIIEAGISRSGEMDNLERMIRPDLGIMSNIGMAHQEGFESLEQKIDEKLQLFRNCKKVVYCRDHQEVHEGMVRNGLVDNSLSWGRNSKSDILIENEKSDDSNGYFAELNYNESRYKIHFPFNLPIFLENALHCVALMIHLGYEQDQINSGLSGLTSIAMRMKVREGLFDSRILDDTYNNDLTGLKAAIDQLLGESGFSKKAVIVSDMKESGLPSSKLYSEIGKLVSASGIDNVITIGKESLEHAANFPVGTLSFQDTDTFLKEFDTRKIQDAIVLVKGSRTFTMERIVSLLEKKAHRTVLEIRLSRVTQNLSYYRSFLNPHVKVMAVIKALAYGSGSKEMARHLLNHGVNYLAVAYVDEGVKIRESGINAPIMVMNPHPEAFTSILANNLEPEIYSLALLKELIAFLQGKELSIHIKIETGMHRLGFIDSEIAELSELLAENQNIQVASIFSHLVGSENPDHDDYTHKQASKLYLIATELRKHITNSSPMLHLLNTGGVTRFPQYQFDMVRLGIGLHGFSPNGNDMPYLEPAEKFRSFISQIRKVKKGETIGYSRQGKAIFDMEIATIGVGYADGFSRQFSNGRGRVYYNGHLLPVIGNVCMDMTMIDVSGQNAKQGDEVIMFGDSPRIEQLASILNTIPYEILAGISERVKRVYTYE